MINNTAQLANIGHIGEPAFEIFKEGHNIFLGGGEGKDFILNEIVNYYESKKITFIILNQSNDWFNNFDKINKAEAIIINNIQMLDVSQFEFLEKVCKENKDMDSIFGGLQVVLCGDFLNLSVEWKSAIDSRIWDELDLKIFYFENLDSGTNSENTGLNFLFKSFSYYGVNSYYKNSIYMKF